MDITMCKGNGCPIKDKCKRATATPDEWQSWFADEPFRIVNGLFKCDMFWGEASELLLTQLTGIVNGKENRGHDGQRTDEAARNFGSKTETDL